ncbi:MAG TPA: hypothetical protein VGM98_15795 [Schlesneria sp.]
MLVAIAKLGSTEMVGQFAIALAVTTPVFVFAQLQLRTVQATDTVGGFCFRDYMLLRAIAATMALSTVIISLFAFAFAAETCHVIVAVASFKTVELFSDVYYGRLQQCEEMDRIGVSLGARGILSLLSLAIVLVSGGSLAMAVWAIAASWMLVLTFWDQQIPATDKSALSENAVSAREVAASVWRLFCVCLPLGGAAVFNSLSTTIPRYILEEKRGLTELGAFAAAASFMLFGNLIVSALAQSAAPRLATYHSRGMHREFTQLLIQLLSFAIGIGVSGYLVAWLFGTQLLSWIFRPEVALYSKSLCWLMFAAAIHSVCFFLNTALAAARSLRIQFPIMVLLALSAVVFGHLWIPSHGVNGAACTIAFVATVQLVLTSSAFMWLCIKKHQFPTLSRPEFQDPASPTPNS